MGNFPVCLLCFLLFPRWDLHVIFDCFSYKRKETSDFVLPEKLKHSKYCMLAVHQK